jgi:nucleoside-triphosphatase THEP1
MNAVNFLYNPDRKSKQQLITEFVIREDILRDVMDELENSLMKTPEQNYLLVGQRGTGKTTLLNRIKYAVEDSYRLKSWLLPIIFSEEQYNISELANLWENIAQLLEDYYGFSGIYEEMEKNIGKKNFEELCWEILEKRLDKAGKKLVLLIDNVGNLFKKIKELEVRRLREILQTRPQIRMIAASPLYLESLLDYKQPLFEYFKVIRLEELNSDETRKLLLKLGDIHNEKEKIEYIIQNDPGRIETLRILGGGVPRTIVLMFNIFIENEHENSLQDLEKILDNVTALYKHRMDDLPAQQQKIVDAVARNWDPISVRALKDRVRLESKVVSAQLRQLEKNQVIQKLETATKNHEYILKERFFNIWYLMRYGRRDDKQRVIWFVRFLESWCTKEDISKRIADFTDAIRNKKLATDSMDFFTKVYTSISNLDLVSKILLEESLPPESGGSIQYAPDEIDRGINESFGVGDYMRCIRIMARRSRLRVSDREKIGKIAIALRREKDMQEKFINMLQDLASRSLSNRSVVGIILWTTETTFAMSLGALLRHNSIEKALELFKHYITKIGGLLFRISQRKSWSGDKLDLSGILLGINQLYSRGLTHSLLKIFNEEFVEYENKKVLLSEIFNPIYLALYSLTEEGKNMNLTAEKEEVVRQIREIIMEK